MVEAHLAWAEGRVAGARARLGLVLEPACVALLKAGLLATDWVPLRCLVGIDRAIAKLVGGDADGVFRELGRHSASLNLRGAYKAFVVEEPHRFFERMALLHGLFQNFGRSVYERTSERSGRMLIDGYEEYSPVFCTGSVGYCEGALEMMGAPKPAHALEIACQCAGDPACIYELAW